MDTNVIIHFFKGEGNVASKLLSKQNSDLAIPAIVHYELLFGAKNSGNNKKIASLNIFLRNIQVVPFAEAEAESSALIRAYLETVGLRIGSLDNLIAGTAVANSAILVTNNIGEFNRIPDLKLEDWY